MALNEEFKNFVLDQLQGIEEFESKRMATADEGRLAIPPGMARNAWRRYLRRW